MSDGSGKTPSLVQEAIVAPLAKGAEDSVEDIKQSIFGTTPKNQNQNKPPADPKIAAQQMRDQKNKRWLQFFFRRMSDDEARLRNQRLREAQEKRAKEEEEQRKKMEVHQIEVVQKEQLKQNVAQQQAKTKAERKGGVGG